MDSREIAELREKAAHLTLEIEAMREPLDQLDLQASYFGQEAENALAELVALLNEILRDKEVK